jgi:hypothetical protein
MEIETVTENTETKSEEKIENGNSLGHFRPFPEITVFIRYFTIGNKFGIFRKNIKSEPIFIKL